MKIKKTDDSKKSKKKTEEKPMPLRHTTPTRTGRGTRLTSASNKSTRTPAQIPGHVKAHMNMQGQITLEDGNGNEIVDAAVLRKIKANPQFIEMKNQLEIQRRRKIDTIIRDSEEENQQYLNICEFCDEVDSEEEYIKQLNALTPETYTKAEYTVPKPTEEQIRNKLTLEAEENVKAFFLTANKKKRQYVEERLQLRLENEISQWEQDQAAFDREQDAIKKEKDEEFYKEYEFKKNLLTSLIEGDFEAIGGLLDTWIESCDLPVDVNIDYAWNEEENVLILDVDLPEIEDLPTTRMEKTATGNLKERKKTQTELRAEYATLVFGLAIFIASNAFNISPAIRKILISGYTQRRDKIGEVEDDYIYSIKFFREIFEGRDLKSIMPMDFCMLFENRCNMTATSMFKVIKPYETF